jgi:membrane protein YdbS with pleckstrin-like domain
MGRRALYWSGLVLVALIAYQLVVWLFGPDANRRLGAALIIAVILSVPVVLLTSRVEGRSRWRRWREARRRALKHHRN